jgi:hypothetical protein
MGMLSDQNSSCTGSMDALNLTSIKSSRQRCFGVSTLEYCLKSPRLLRTRRDKTSSVPTSLCRKSSYYSVHGNRPLQLNSPCLAPTLGYLTKSRNLKSVWSNSHAPFGLRYFSQTTLFPSGERFHQIWRQGPKQNDRPRGSERHPPT